MMTRGMVRTIRWTLSHKRCRCGRARRRVASERRLEPWRIGSAAEERAHRAGGQRRDDRRAHRRNRRRRRQTPADRCAPLPIRGRPASRVAHPSADCRSRTRRREPLAPNVCGLSWGRCHRLAKRRRAGDVALSDEAGGGGSRGRSPVAVLAPLRAVQSQRSALPKYVGGKDGISRSRPPLAKFVLAPF